MSEAGRYTVVLTEGADADLAAIHDYLVQCGEPARVDALLDRLLAAAETLTRFPERGSCPKELAAIGIRAYRQSLFKPYRMIYEVLDHRVVVHLVADGRRNMQSVLGLRTTTVCAGSRLPTDVGTCSRCLPIDCWVVDRYCCSPRALRTRVPMRWR